MIRRAAAVVLALMFNPALVSAQDATFTVTVPSADVYKGPTNVTPVIGRAPRGTVLPVSRNLGSWAKVAWPDAPDGVGYVHLTMGRLESARAAAPAAAAPAASTASRTPADPGPGTTAMPPPVRRDRIAVSDQMNGTPITHIFGVGGRLGSTRSFGATARAWHTDRVGFQFALTRDAMTSDAAAGRVTSMQVESAAVYSLFDHVSDYIWIRPYIGSGVSFHHQNLKDSSPDGLVASDNGFGFRAFAGSELTFASVQRLGLSVELGYRRVPTPFPGFEADTLSASIAGHWYIK
jgi:outer membrane protein W